MRALLVRLALSVRDRIESKGAGYGLIYPWWIPVTATVGLVGSALVGAAQRDALAPPEAGALFALALVAVPFVAHFAIRPWLPWWIESLSILAAVALMLSDALPTGEIDVVPVALAVLVAEVTVSEGKKIGFVAALLSSATVVGFGEFDANLLTLYIAEICFGLVFGYMLRWQMRALAAEHLARDEERERATLDERQRVAREIHDLVAHSLSVTMLHVTGARRALSEGAGPDDVAEAIEALTDAERIGRQAMADIRRTVSVLA
ncbi:MAG: histidine kinase dimerization/phosphoacceptor domain-containing protein, partial [Nocardioides sp.]